jgi:hypothetical protein
MVGSGIWKKPIPDPGSGGQKGTGSRIRNTGPYFKKVQIVSIPTPLAHARQTFTSLILIYLVSTNRDLRKTKKV